MFYYLDGVVTLVDGSTAVLDIGGAGYACSVTLSTLSRLEVGKKARLYTYCNIKEDAFDIYGFFETGEKRCFELLITVSGVGPKAALSILSVCTPEVLALAIINDDEAVLTQAPGIGKKLAQRVILELKDKVAKTLGDMKLAKGAASPALVGTAGGKQADAAAALGVLGYSQSEISAAMRDIDAETMSVEEMIRHVLKSSLK